MEPCATYQNTHHQLTVVIGSQRGKTCWPFRFKLMSNINPFIIIPIVLKYEHIVNKTVLVCLLKVQFTTSNDTELVDVDKMFSHIPICTHAYQNTCMHACTHTHARAHTHTHIQIHNTQMNAQ